MRGPRSHHQSQLNQYLGQIAPQKAPIFPCYSGIGESPRTPQRGRAHSRSSRPRHSGPSDQQPHGAPGYTASRDAKRQPQSVVTSQRRSRCGCSEAEWVQVWAQQMRNTMHFRRYRTAYGGLHSASRTCTVTGAHASHRSQSSRAIALCCRRQS